MGTINQTELEQLNTDLYALIWRPTRDDTEVLEAKLRHRVHNFECDDVRDRENLFKAIIFAGCAAGQAPTKEYWIKRFEAVWVPLESKLHHELTSGLDEKRPYAALSVAHLSST